MKPDDILVTELTLYNIGCKSTCLRLTVFKFESIPKSPGGLVKVQTSGAHPEYLF